LCLSDDSAPGAAEDVAMLDLMGEGLPDDAQCLRRHPDRRIRVEENDESESGEIASFLASPRHESIVVGHVTSLSPQDA